ncbi:hypothetical protein [Pelosinus sp. sgz500959]|uniref:hypothetical protein n=1 Tax=Pelosinus sp. sgz500959 TaxID=3242472 RepID=UPI00367025CF
MEGSWDEKCQDKKHNDQCIINIFCNCNDGKKQDGKCQVKLHENNDDKWCNKEHDGKCIINIFCSCNDDKKKDCQCDEESKW